MKEKRIVMIAVAIIVLLLSLTAGYYFLTKDNKSTEKNTNPQPTGLSTASTNDFLLAGYPIDEVPLVKLKKVSSSKFFTNSDPKNSSPFDESPFSYFNVVFETTATQAEFLEYYRDLFDSEIKEEFPSENTVKGIKGEYKITASHYGSNNTGYLQIHVNEVTLKEINYFADFPHTIADLPYIAEHERSYGLLNQKGGEVEFTQYFTILNTGDQNNDGKDDINELEVLVNRVMSTFDRKENFNFETTSKTFTWKEDDFSKTLVVSEDHNRIYIMMRKGIQ